MTFGRELHNLPSYCVAVPIAPPEAGVPVSPLRPRVGEDDAVGRGVAQLGVGDEVLITVAAALSVGLDFGVPEAKSVGVGVHSGGVADRDGAAAGVVPSMLVSPAVGVPVPVGPALSAPVPVCPALGVCVPAIAVPAVKEGAAAGVVPRVPVPAALGVPEPTSAGPGVLVPISPTLGGLVRSSADVGVSEGSPAGVVALLVFDPEAQPAATKVIATIAASGKTNRIFILAFDSFILPLDSHLCRKATFRRLTDDTWD